MSPRRRFRAGGVRAGGVRTGGFTLVETALVLLVIGLLTRAFLAPLGESLERRRHAEAERLLDDAHRALVGHLITRGVLPCPLPPSGGRSSDGNSGASVAGCRSGSGRLPAVALGVPGPVDADGALLDPWGRALLYSVSLASSDRAGARDRPDWTSEGELAAVGLAQLSADLVLCDVAASGACPRDALRADAVAFVVLSRGRDDSGEGAQRENLDGDRVHVLAPHSAVDGHRFDDTLVWASRNELAYWLLRAGWLP